MENQKKFYLGKAGVSASVLKTIAIIGMTLDHIGIVFSDYLSLEWRCVLFAFGGLTFPIMAFLIGEGYRKTSNFKKYALRLFLFALIAQVPYMFLGAASINVIFTLFLGLIAIHLYETMENRVLYWFTFSLMVIGSAVFDWGLIGVPMILLYYTIKNHRLKLVIPYIFPVLLMVVPEFIMIIAYNTFSALPNILFVLIGCTLTIPLLDNYNGKKGKSIKYFFYLYYPVHITILVMLKYFLERVLIIS